MTSDRSLWLFAATLALLALAGCGGEFPTAAISGVVTLDGEALPNASVYFQPQRRSDNPIVGPPSMGVTDESGRFTLRTTEGANGAVVGEHVVSISTLETRMVDPQNSDRVEVVSQERVPSRYRAPSELSLTVRRGGDEQANFDLTTQ